LKKKYGIVFSWQAVLVLSFLLIIFSGGGYLGNYTISNYYANRLITECDAIDRALEMYAKSHRSVLTDTTRIYSDSNKLIYESGRVYPDNLSELGIVQSEDGYFTTKINLNQFSYQTQKNANGKMTYELGVNLPNGVHYTSPRSNK